MSGDRITVWTGWLHLAYLAGFGTGLIAGVALGVLLL